MTTYDFIAKNKRKTVWLIAIFSALVIGVGYFLDQYYQSGGSILLIAVAYAVISALVGYYAGDKVALASSGAQQISRDENPYLMRMVENLSISMGLPMPKVHIINDDAINAFATGRDPQHASIAVTTGAIRKLENEELEGVIAHELSHIGNYDIRVMTLVIVLVGVISIIADFALRGHIFGGRRSNDNSSGSGPLAIIGIVLVVLSPIIAELIKLSISRRREYLADATGALATRYPQGLANALRKIGAESQPMQRASTATAHLFIANPFSGKFLGKLFSTHPPIEKRIEALEQMGQAH